MTDERLAYERPVRLLAGDEPAPFSLICELGRSPFLLVVDHAGNRIPRSLHGLGLSNADGERHIAWDIGVAGLAQTLATRLDACAVLQTYSRLVIDCNRPLIAPDSIARQSDGSLIPGNQQLTAQQVAARQREIFEPYHAAIRAVLQRRAMQGQPTVLIALHSFTPQMAGQARPWHVGVLYQRDTRLARALLQLLRSDSSVVVGDNEPYSVSDETDYAIPHYGESAGLLHVELEVRQDLIADAAGQESWGRKLAAWLPAALQMTAVR